MAIPTIMWEERVTYVLNRINEHLARPDHTTWNDQAFMESIRKELGEILKASKRP